MSGETEGEMACLPDIPRQPGVSPPNTPDKSSSVVENTDNNRQNQLFQNSRNVPWMV